jgi:hypothetical protein
MLMVMLLLANRFRMFTDFPKPLAVVFSCVSRAALELQTPVLKQTWELQIAF